MYVQDREKLQGLGLLANKSLIKAFEVGGTEPPMEAIKFSQKRWESIFNEC